MGFRRSRDTVERHRQLLEDGVRSECYERAIAATVSPGDAVVDIGCGTGLLSFFACRAGARRVYAIDYDEAIQLARRLAEVNGFGDRVVFLEDLSTRVELPERVDVVLTETLWNFGVGEGLLRSVSDARERFLREGGSLVPCRLELNAAPVECSAAYERFAIWREDIYGLDFQAVKPYAVNNVYTWTLDPAMPLAEPCVAKTIDLGAVHDMDITADMTFSASRDGVVHGVGGWFTAELAPGITLSNGPPNPVPSWQHAFFPLERPVPVRSGDGLQVALRSLEEGLAWRWTVKHVPSGDREPVTLDQSSIKGFLLSPDELRKARPDYKPSLSPLGQAVQFVLGAADGSRSVEAIAEELLHRYPEAIRTRDDAGRLVRNMMAHFA